MPLVPVERADDDRLADYVRLRETSLRRSLESAQGLFIAEGEKVIRRAVEAGYRPRSFLLAPRWLDSLQDVLERWPDVPVHVVSEAAGRGGHRLPRPPRGAGVAAPRAAARRRRPAGPRAAGRLRGRRRPHQRRGPAPQRRRPRLGRRPALTAGGGPALPARRQGQHGGRLLAALGAAARLARRSGAAGRRRLHHARADPGARRRRPGRGGRRPGPDAAEGRGAAGHRGRRAVGALDAARPPPAPPSRWHAGIDSLNVAAAAAIACYVLGQGPRQSSSSSSSSRTRGETGQSSG